MRTDTATIRHELLFGDDAWLRDRRRIATVAACLAAELAIVGLRQYGVIRRLPDPPLPFVDSNAVTTSRAAYPLGIPDAALAVTGCGALIALATARGSERTGRPQLLDRALAAAGVVGGLSAAAYVGDMVLRQKRVCVYCLAAATGLAWIARAALPGLTRRRS
jgi:uncharacterized membrane protein